MSPEQAKQLKDRVEKLRKWRDDWRKRYPLDCYGIDVSSNIGKRGKLTVVNQKDRG